MQARTNKHEIWEYIRRRKGGKVFKVGAIAGTRIGDTIKIGWSKCNLKCGDKFDAEKGIDMAFNRAEGRTTMTPAPLCVQSQVRQFGARCVRYFKGAGALEMPI